MCVCVCVNKTEKQALQLCIACHCALWQSPVGSSHKTLKLFYPNQCGTSFNKRPSGFKRWKKETQVFKLTFYIENHLFSCVPSGEDMEKKSTASLTLHSSVSTSLWWMTRYNIWQSTSLLICTFTLNLKKKKRVIYRHDSFSSFPPLLLFIEGDAGIFVAVYALWHSLLMGWLRGGDKVDTDDMADCAGGETPRESDVR